MIQRADVNHCSIYKVKILGRTILIPHSCHSKGHTFQAHGSRGNVMRSRRIEVILMGKLCCEVCDV